MPEYYSGNRFLSESEMTVNARFIYDYLTSRGWTGQAVCGMLGNMETESTINPAIWQNLDEGNTSLGFGLVQWTPATKYLNWCDVRGLDPEKMESALSRILWELANGEQFYATDAYPLTFQQFKVSTASPTYLAMTFLNNYERPADRNQPARGQQAEKWYSILSGSEGGGGGSEEPDTPDVPDVPDTPTVTRKRHKMSLLLLLTATQRK